MNFAVAQKDIAASHQDRLGCSEIAVALGLVRWKSRFKLWEEKTRRVIPPDVSGKIQIKLGHWLEAIVASLYQSQTGNRVQRVLREYTRPDLPLVGHIDRRIVGERAGLEIKTSLGRFPSSDWGEPGTDQIPPAYLAQCLGYLMLTGWERWDVAALLAGPELRIYHVHPDPELMTSLAAAIKAFWQCVETDTPPDPITVEDAARRWPVALGGAIAADVAAIQAVERLRAVEHDLAALTAEKDALKLALMQQIGDAEALTDGGHTLCTWRTQTSRRFDLTEFRAAQPAMAEQYTRETTSRVFRLSKKIGENQ